MASAEGQDKIRQMVTDSIIAGLETNVVPWHRPWIITGSGGYAFPMSMSTNRPYRGINVWLLSLEAMAKGYRSAWWGTWDACCKAAGMVQVKQGKRTRWVKPRLKDGSEDPTPRGPRKDEHRTMVVFNRRYTWLDNDDLDDDGKPKRKQRYVLRYYYVFNAEQVDGLPPKYQAPKVKPDAPQPTEAEVITEAETVVRHYLDDLAGPRLVHDDPDRAFYRQSDDLLNMPPDSSFDGVGERYSTLFHELVHSTGHKDRLARREMATFGHFGDQMYGREELTAEMGNAMLCALTGVHGVFDNSVAYVQSWLKQIRGDNTLVIAAAGRAQRAVDYVLGITYENNDDNESESES